jgi:uncharacterized integral membrane protein
MDGNPMETEEEHRAGQRRGISLGLVVGIVITAAIAALIGQNTKTATIRWLVFEGDMPIWLLLFVTAVAGAVLSHLLGFAWRRRRAHADDR